FLMKTNNNSSVSSDSTSSQEISNIEAHINNKKFTLVVWNNFTLIKFADSSPNKAKYNHCEKRFSYKRSSGTSHLYRHLKTCKKYKITTAGSSSLDDYHNKDNQMQYISNQAKSWVYSEERIDFNVEPFQNYCLAHIINLIVQNGIKKISNIVKKHLYINTSIESNEGNLTNSDYQFDEDYYQYASKRLYQNANNLYEIAKDFLAIPATSVPSEQIFSLADRIIDDNQPSNLITLLTKEEPLYSTKPITKGQQTSKFDNINDENSTTPTKEKPLNSMTPITKEESPNLMTLLTKEEPPYSTKPTIKKEQ
ncbi:20924_t:CDS:2, partial [Dentiscutata erythropus]